MLFLRLSEPALINPYRYSVFRWPYHYRTVIFKNMIYNRIPSPRGIVKYLQVFVFYPLYGAKPIGNCYVFHIFYVIIPIIVAVRAS